MNINHANNFHMHSSREPDYFNCIIRVHPKLALFSGDTDFNADTDTDIPIYQVYWFPILVIISLRTEGDELILETS